MGGAGVQRRLAARGGADAAQQLVRLGVLEQVAARAGVERGEHLDAVAERGQDDDLGARRLAFRTRRVVSMPSIPGIARSTSATSGFRSRASVAPVLPSPAWPTTSSSRVGGDQPGEPGADQRVVVDQQDADHSFSRILVPWPGVERISSAPPCSRARSSSIRRPRWGRSSSGLVKPWPSSLDLDRVACVHADAHRGSRARGRRRCAAPRGRCGRRAPRCRGRARGRRSTSSVVSQPAALERREEVASAPSRPWRCRSSG